ncbi:GspH/FimT family pseudopilin [Marinobacter sp. CA1]|uniref:GspH/FimT family pseudopilin n=1 Tax=Marinobacter sp. CA1 TaxID=2817656 RepID=UPI001D083B96|nr:GspH/FimT family protein [Marinobacter sp. CA1]UDL04369.1 GspH/FimT family protein [Marinobacter sp. CA1]
MNTGYHQGLTLVELLLVVSILSITLGIGIPSITQLIEKTHRQDSLYQLLNGLSFARTEAITRGTVVTLCPLDNKNQCSNNWNQPITVFSDPLKKRELSDADAILRIIEPPKSGKLYGRTGIRRHFGFRPTGMARESIGHLLWCPNDRLAEKAFQIRINMGGRPLIAEDADGDGIVEDTYGQNIRCP